MSTYKIITREYYDEATNTRLMGKFIAEGRWADGHLAYSRLNDDNEVIDGEECAYYQIRVLSHDDWHKETLFMRRI